MYPIKLEFSCVVRFHGRFFERPFVSIGFGEMLAQQAAVEQQPPIPGGSDEEWGEVEEEEEEEE